MKQPRYPGFIIYLVMIFVSLSIAQAKVSSPLAKESIGLITYSQLSSPDCGPSNIVVHDMNVQFGSHFHSWSSQPSGEVGIKYLMAAGPNTRWDVFFEANPIQGHLYEQETVIGDYGPQHALLDWRSNHFKIGAEFQRLAIIKHPRINIGAQVFAFSIDSHVNTSLYIPALDMETGGQTQFCDTSIGSAAFLESKVASVYGHPILLSAGYNWTFVSGSAVGIMRNPAGIPGNTSVVPVRMPASENFSGAFLRVNIQW